MENIESRWICTNCGYRSLERFVGDICPKCGLTYWQCIKCGFTFMVASPPDVCPECDEQSDFINITCYIPDWNGPEYVGPHLSQEVNSPH